jgi:hypothetical protein
LTWKRAANKWNKYTYAYTSEEVADAFLEFAIASKRAGNLKEANSSSSSSSNRMFSVNSFLHNRHRVVVDDEYPMPMDHPCSLGSTHCRHRRRTRVSYFLCWAYLSVFLILEI